jgi:hypothetical protein
MGDPQKPPGDPPTTPPKIALYYPIEPEPKKPKPPKPPKKFISAGFRPPTEPRPDPKPRPTRPTKVVAHAGS